MKCGRRLLQYVLNSALLWVAAAGAQETSFCDPYLRSAVDHPFAYGPVADRCEGIFEQEVASSVLHLASLSAAYPHVDFASEQPLHLSWQSVGDETVQLRANSLRRRLYYRMDTRQAGGGSPYVWPHDLLVALDMQPAELGLLAWVDRVLGTAQRTVYLPLVLSQGDVDPAPGAYELVIVPGRELRQLYLGLVQLDGNGDPVDTARQMRKMPGGYYPAHHGVRLPVPELPAPGLYGVQLSAVLRDGGSATLEFTFYHAQP